jgi:hypothetical protein
MATTNVRRIALSGEFEYVQKVAAGTVKPGHLMQLDSAGKYNVNSTVTVDAQKLFAREDSHQGGIVSGSYAAGDQIFGVIPYPGSKVNCVLKTGDTVALGAPLYSAGDGTLTVTKGSAVNVIGFAEEAVTTAAAGEFCQIRIA